MKKFLLSASGLLLLLLTSCASGETMCIPPSIEVIMEEAYAGDTAFDRLILPAGIREIGSRAFSGCGFEAVYLPPSLETLGENAFDSDVEIYVCPDSPIEGTLFEQGIAYTPVFLPSSIALPEEFPAVAPGQQALIGVTAVPERADTAHLIWSSSDESVASVSREGIVTGISEGSAVITAETLNGVSAKTTVVISGRKPVCRALLVANVNYYEETARWNEGDISLLKTMFASVNAPNGEPWEVTVLYDLYDTKMEAAIRDTFADTQEGDISLIHVSSHGYRKRTSRGYADPGLRMSRGSEMTRISYPTLEEWMSSYIKGDKVLFLETCYASGAFEGGSGDPFAKDGYYVYAACRYDEHCYSADGKYNYFVLWFTAGVRGMAADANGDGAVTLGELNNYTYAIGCRTNVGAGGSTTYQHSAAYPADSDYVLFVKK